MSGSHLRAAKLLPPDKVILLLLQLLTSAIQLQTYPSFESIYLVQKDKLHRLEMIKDRQVSQLKQSDFLEQEITVRSGNQLVCNRSNSLSGCCLDSVC